MTIKLEKVGKKFGVSRIFSDLTYTFESNKSYAVTGANGSGKSTLLKTVSGMLTPNEGRISYHAEHVLSPDEFLLRITYCAPYMDLPEELKVAELIDFHSTHRKLIVSGNELMREVNLKPEAFIGDLSSGMKQRLKLALALFTKAEVVFLDEPTSNFDKMWEGWYRNQIEQISGSATIIIASNQPHEYEGLVEEIINM